MAKKKIPLEILDGYIGDTIRESRSNKTLS